MLASPAQLAIDAHGNLLVADTGNSRIRLISPAGIISTIAGNGTFGYSGDGGPAQNAALGDPTAVAVDPLGNVLIADYTNHVIRRVDSAGIIQTVAGNGSSGFSGDGGPATAAQLTGPESIAFDTNGNYYIGDAPSRVRKVDTAES